MKACALLAFLAGLLPLQAWCEDPCSKEDLAYGRTAKGMQAPYSERKPRVYCDGQVFVAHSGSIEVVSFVYAAPIPLKPPAAVQIDAGKAFASIRVDHLILNAASLSVRGNYKLDARMARASPKLEIGRESGFSRLNLSTSEVGWLAWFETEVGVRVLVPVAVGTAGGPPSLLLRIAGRLAQLEVKLVPQQGGANAVREWTLTSGIHDGAIVPFDLSGVPAGQYSLQVSATEPTGAEISARTRRIFVPA